MTSAKIEKFFKKYVVPTLPEYLATGRLLYESKRTGILRGIYIEQSASAADCSYIWCLAVPLYVPTTVVSLSYGHRLTKDNASGTGWNLTLNPEESALLLLNQFTKCKEKFLSQLASPRGFAQHISATSDNRNIRREEALAYSWILCGEVEKARASLARVAQYDDIPAWVGEVKKRAERVKDALGYENIDAAQALLRAWEADSEAALRLSFM